MQKKLPEIITEAEFLQILKATDKPEHKLAFALAFYQGMRISEIVGLHAYLSRCCNALVLPEIKLVDEKKRKLMKCSACQKILSKNEVYRAKDEWQIEPLTNSNIDVGQRLIRLKDAKGGKDRNIPIAPEVMKGITKHLPIKCGRRALEIAFKKSARKILNKELHFHSLRHGSATHYLNVKKWDIRLVQQFLGHENLNTTMIYTHVSPQNLVDKMWEGNK